jgi:hypothetical protein
MSNVTGFVEGSPSAPSPAAFLTGSDAATLRADNEALASVLGAVHVLLTRLNWEYGLHADNMLASIEAALAQHKRS